MERAAYRSAAPRLCVVGFSTEPGWPRIPSRSREKIEKRAGQGDRRGLFWKRPNEWRPDQVWMGGGLSQGWSSGTCARVDTEGTGEVEERVRP